MGAMSVCIAYNLMGAMSVCIAYNLMDAMSVFFFPAGIYKSYIFVNGETSPIAERAQKHDLFNPLFCLTTIILQDCVAIRHYGFS